jgi:hypothetical protein
LSASLFAQSDTPSITGFVRDSSAGVVPNANVVISSLPAGFYTVSVEATGFKTYEKTRNKLNPNIATTVDAGLRVGSASEVVNVVAEAVNLRSASATLRRVVTSSEIKNIPLNGRNPLFRQ